MAACCPTTDWDLKDGQNWRSSRGADEPNVWCRSMEQAVADLVGPDLRVLFCGINPGTWSGDLGLHFARPGNRFWKLLCAGGFTESVLSPAEQHTLPGLGIGITNLVDRVTVAASELSVAELREGATQLEAKVEMVRPRRLVVLGLQAYRTAFQRPKAEIGPSPNVSAAPLSGSSPTRAAFRPTISCLK